MYHRVSSYHGHLLCYPTEDRRGTRSLGAEGICGAISRRLRMERDPRTSAVLCSLSRGGAPSRAALLLRLALAPLLHACFSLVLGTRELSMGFGRDESTAAGSCAQPRPRQRHLAAQAGSAIIQASMERAATQPRSNAPTYAAQWTGQHTTALRRRGNCSAPIAVLLNANKSRAAQRRSPTFGTDGFATCTHEAGRRGGHNTTRRTRGGAASLRCRHSSAPMAVC